MIEQSTQQLPKFQFRGNTLIIRCNGQTVIKQDENGDDVTNYQYCTVKVPKSSTRHQRIEAIIKIKYPTYGAELAAMHKGGDETETYLAWRETAYQVAAESFEEF